MTRKVTTGVKRANKYLLIQIKVFITRKSWRKRKKIKNNKKIKNPIINSVEVNDEKPSTIGDVKIKNSKHILKEKVSN